MATREKLEHADPKAAARAMWALGDYHHFSLETVWDVGPVLVEATGIRPGQRLLDVAAGTGNVAIRAAEAGAVVVASDLTPENFEAGREEARRRGVELEWVEADAEHLPFADEAFDAVTSCFGAMFAPDHRATADELVRVCRRGGVVVLAGFTAEGTGLAFFAALGSFMPAPPADASPPLLWGDEHHVRDLLADRVSLELERRTYIERSPSPEAYRELFATSFGPIVGLRQSLESDPARLEQLDERLAAFAVSENTGEPGGPAAYEYGYLLVVARRR